MFKLYAILKRQNINEMPTFLSTWDPRSIRQSGINKLIIQHNISTWFLKLRIQRATFIQFTHRAVRDTFHVDINCTYYILGRPREKSGLFYVST